MLSDVEYRLFSLDEKGVMCVWAVEDTDRMEYVATTVVPPGMKPYRHVMPARAIYPCGDESQFVLVRGDMNRELRLMQSIRDPKHRQPTLDYRMVCQHDGVCLFAVSASLIVCDYDRKPLTDSLTD